MKKNIVIVFLFLIISICLIMIFNSKANDKTIIEQSELNNKCKELIEEFNTGFYAQGMFNRDFSYPQPEIRFKHAYGVMDEVFDVELSKDGKYAILYTTYTEYISKESLVSEQIPKEDIEHEVYDEMKVKTRLTYKDGEWMPEKSEVKSKYKLEWEERYLFVDPPLIID